MNIILGITEFIIPLTRLTLSRNPGIVPLEDENPSGQPIFARRPPSPLEPRFLLRFLLPVLMLLRSHGLGQEALSISSQPTVAFSAAGYIYSEDGLPLAAQVTLVRDLAAGDTTVNVTFPGSGTATIATDYDSTPIPVTFSGNELTKTLDLHLTQDNIVELDETFGLTLSAVTNATIGTQDSTAVTILNDDQSVITLTGGDVIEGDSGTPKMVFTVTMSKEVDVPVTAMILSGTGGATNGVDFRSKSSIITVTTSGTRFEIDIIPDNLAENTEYIVTALQKRLVEASGRDVILNHGVNGFLFMYGIRDDDFAPIAFDDGIYTGIEGETLTINASIGLLANVTDQDDGNGPEHLSAILKSAPTHGQLVLDGNGGFRYTPAPDFSGADSFTYAASDGTNQSIVRIARINVTEQIDLAVGVDLLQSPLVAGGEALDVFRVSATNMGPSNATGVKLTQNTLFPADVNMVSATPTTGTFSGGVWSLDLAENATATLTVTVQAKSAAVGGTNVIPLGFAVSASNQPEVNHANNMAVASASIINAAETRTDITVSPMVDRQSGLLVSKVTVTHYGSVPIPAFRLYVRNLPGDMRVYNARGIRSYGTPPTELPYLLFNRPLAAGASTTLTIEFFRPTLDPRFTPQYEIELLPVPEAEPASASGGIPVTRNQMLSNRDHLIEIASIPGGIYAVEYSHDLATWKRVVPTITAPANRLQWIDNGPPKTTSHPSAVPNRYYRFVLISNP